MVDFTDSAKSSNYDADIAAGRKPGISFVRLDARSSNLTPTPKTLWGDTGDYIFSYSGSGEAWEVVSTSANDALGGTGAQIVELSVTVDGFTQLVKLVELDGLTPVGVELNDNVTLNRMAVSAIDAGQFSDGDITCRVVGGDNRGIIKAGKNEAQDAIYQVPAGFTWYLESVFWGVKKGDDVEFVVQATFGDNGIWYDFPHLEAYQQADSVQVASIKFVEKSFIRIIANSSNPFTEASANLLMRQEQNA
jgi:hypothetical protein